MVSHLETSIDPIFLPGGGGGGTLDFKSTLQIKVLLGCYLATNSFGLGRLFTNQVASLKILGGMVTRMVPT